MLKHFYLGRRASFPSIFIVLAFVLFITGILYARLMNSQLAVSPSDDLKLLIAAVSSAAAFVYFLYTQHHQDTQTFISFFEKFNRRYDGLNEKLNAIIDRPANSQFGPKEKDTLYDYFNLCSEEYLFYESGYIDERVWRAWLFGMKHYAKDAAVRRLWEQELESSSYYKFKMSLFDFLDSDKNNK